MADYFDRNRTFDNASVAQTNFTTGGLTFLLKGYTSRCKINDFPILMTNYGLSFDTNVIKGSGVMPIYQGPSQSGQFVRMRGNALRDYPGYHLSLACEATEGIFKEIVLPGFEDYFVKPFDILFEDEASGIEYHFEKAFATKCGFSVSESNAIQITFDFAIYRDAFEIRYGDNKLFKGGDASDSSDSGDYGNSGFISNLVGNKLLAYYHFGVEYTGFQQQPLVAFQIDFSHEITPKYGCVGMHPDSHPMAPPPMKLIFSPPSVSYTLTYVLAKKNHNDDYHLTSEGNDFSEDLTSYYASNQIVMEGGSKQMPEKTLAVYFVDQKMLEFTLCHPTTYTPQIGDKGEPPKLEIAGEVYGKMTVSYN